MALADYLTLKDRSLPVDPRDSRYFAGLDAISQQIYYIAARALLALEANHCDRCHKPSSIFQKAIDNGDIMPDFGLDNFETILAQRVANQGLGIISPMGVNGYYFSGAISKLEPETEDEVDAEELYNPHKERVFYVPVENWMVRRGLISREVSRMRILGAWSNPDLLGLKLTDCIQGMDIDIISVEVKLSREGWRHNIFQAVSHKRYANRVYFAFAEPRGEQDVNFYEELRYYCDVYGIGVLSIQVEDKPYYDFMTGGEDLQPEDMNVVELFSSSYRYVPPRYQNVLLNALGIRNKDDLMDFVTDEEG